MSPTLEEELGAGIRAHQASSLAPRHPHGSRRSLGTGCGGGDRAVTLGCAGPCEREGKPLSVQQDARVDL